MWRYNKILDVTVNTSLFDARKIEYALEITYDGIIDSPTEINLCITIIEVFIKKDAKVFFRNFAMFKGINHHSGKAIFFGDKLSIAPETLQYYNDNNSEGLTEILNDFKGCGVDTKKLMQVCEKHNLGTKTNIAKHSVKYPLFAAEYKKWSKEIDRYLADNSYFDVIKKFS